MNIGLVLSGGMAKGAYQIGALRALDNFIPQTEIRYMSCASVGVLNGYAFATGHLDRAEQMWESICSQDVRLIINQILRSSMLQQNISNIYDKKTNLSHTFYCSLLDIGHRNIIYKDLSLVEQTHIPLYLKASVAMPIYNRAVRINQELYFDGAMVDNIPIYPLLKHDLDYIICIYFDDVSYKFESSCVDDKIIKLTFPSKNMLRQSLVFTKENIEEMIKTGYDRTTFILNAIFSEGYTNKTQIYKNIHLLNQNGTNDSLRVTGDILVTNLNKVTQKLTRRKIL